MLKFLTRRLISSAITLVGVVVMVFFLARLTGSPVDLFFPEGAAPERIEAFNRAYGLDKPVIEQFRIFLWRACRATSATPSGSSVRRWRPPGARCRSRIALAAISLSVSTDRDRARLACRAPTASGLVDRAITFFSLALGSMPAFWFALVGILLFAVQWRLLPTSGSNSWPPGSFRSRR